MTTTRRRPGPNDALPCGTESAMRRHDAHGQSCRTCWPRTGLAPMPAATDPYTPPGWLERMIREEFWAGLPMESAA